MCKLHFVLDEIEKRFFSKHEELKSRTLSSPAGPWHLASLTNLTTAGDEIERALQFYFQVGFCHLVMVGIPHCLQI